MFSLKKKKRGQFSERVNDLSKAKALSYLIPISALIHTLPTQLVGKPDALYSADMQSGESDINGS